MTLQLSALIQPRLENNHPDGRGEAENQEETETQKSPQRSTGCLPPLGKNDDASDKADD